MSNCIKCGALLPEGAAFCCACGKKQSQERKHRKRANGTGSICRLSGKRAKPWLARRNDVCIGTFATRAEAQKALERITDATITEKYNLTFAQIYERWFPEHERDIGETAKGNYRSAMKHCQALHDLRFRSLRASDFQGVIISMEKKGLSKSSCEKVLQLFGQLSAWAIREGIMQTSYAQFCTIAAEAKSEGRVFSEAEIRAIRNSGHPAADIVMILLSTGCRGNELFSVPLENCKDRYFISGSKTNAGRNRVIAVAEDGLAAYHKLLNEARRCNGSLLIDGYSGNRTYANFAKREFKVLMQQLQLEGYTPYDCRHTFTTLAIRSGVDKQTLRRMLGHADLSTTDKYYTHLDLEDILGAADELRLIGAVSNKSVTRSARENLRLQKSS